MKQVSRDYFLPSYFLGNLLLLSRLESGYTRAEPENSISADTEYDKIIFVNQKRKKIHPSLNAIMENTQKLYL